VFSGGRICFSVIAKLHKELTSGQPYKPEMVLRMRPLWRDILLYLLLLYVEINMHFYYGNHVIGQLFSGPKAAVQQLAENTCPGIWIETARTISMKFNR